MSAEPIKGAPLAKALREETVAAAAGTGVVPTLANVVVGDLEPSAAYLDAIDKAAEKHGFAARRILLPGEISEEALCEAVSEAGRDPSLHGLMIQFPLPAGVRRERVTALLPPAKDVDGCHPESLGLVLAGRRSHTAPCTAAAVAHILGSDPRLHPRGRHVVVVGRSLVVGRPLAAMLTASGADADATVTVCHSRTPDVARHTRAADIVVMATGVRHMLTPGMVREGAIVIDVGTHPVQADDGRWTLDGDVRPDVAEVAAFMTPVPGGVGPVTNSILMRHLAAAAFPGRIPPAW